MPGPAARVAGWQQRYGTWPSHTIPVGTPPVLPFPQVPLDVSVAIYVDGSWIDITPWVFGGDRAEIEITRGRPDEANRVDRSRATFQVNNRDGQFSPRNPTSWLYGKIGRNTRVRIAVGADVRFSGEISEWPPKWDTTGTDIYVPIEASGILRRLGQGAPPLKSTLYRAYTTLTGSDTPKAYWPCEDAEGATQLGSALAGKPAMTIIGSPSLAQSTDFRSSAPIPLLSNSRWSGTIPTYPSTGNIQVWWLQSIPAGGATDGVALFTLHTNGTVKRWDVIYHTGGNLRLRGYDSENTIVVDSGSVAFNVNGNPMRMCLNLDTVGSDIEWDLLAQTLTEIVGGIGGTAAGESVTIATKVALGPNGNLDDIVMGHVSVHSEIRSPFDFVEDFLAYKDEAAGRRIQRLCGEEGIDLRAVGNLNATLLMGPQLPKALVDLLQECAAADGGVLYEPRDTFGLAYRTRESMYHQAPALTLDYPSAHLSGIEPTDDDQLVRNDITVKRESGSSAHVVKESGPLSILPPPDGVGRYDEEVTLNLQGDAILASRASWQLHLGTVDEARYPVLSLDLARLEITSNPDLPQVIRSLDVGDRLVVTNPPTWLPPEDISQLAQGFTEVLGNFTHRIGVNCSPESPWSGIGAYDGVVRYESQGATLAEDLDTTETGVDVTVLGPLWTTAAGDLPFNVRVGGEQMTVTAVTGAASPQTFTVTRSVNGVVKTHLSGAVVELDPTFVYAL